MVTQAGLPVIVYDGDDAETRSTGDFEKAGGKRVSGGLYADKLVRIDDNWLIANRKIVKEQQFARESNGKKRSCTTRPRSRAALLEVILVPIGAMVDQAIHLDHIALGDHPPRSAFVFASDKAASVPKKAMVVVATANISVSMSSVNLPVS